MGVFDDKKFEQLDWMSQMTETIESEVNGLLARLPDRLQLDQNVIISLMNTSYRLCLSPSNVVRQILRSTPDRFKLTYEDELTINSCFELEMSEEFILDIENNTMIGEIHLVKIKATIDDETLQSSLGQDGLSRLRLGNINTVTASLGRANDIMELLGGLDDAIRGRSWRRKINGIHQRLSAILKNNEWRIRDATLANKVGKWIMEYIQTGNLAAYSNFCKLKVMTHQNMPIYSIEEQQ